MNPGAGESAREADFEKQVDDYIRRFPYQETHNYMAAHLQGDPGRLNRWLGPGAVLVPAGEDTIVRSNNDTFYKIAFVVLDNGPVVITSSAPSDDRFSSFQLMDDRNANYRNIVHPAGQYSLFRGAEPDHASGEAISVPSNLSVVLVRVEVRDKDDQEDVAAATAVFDGITIEGPTMETAPELDLLSGFDEAVEREALRRMDEALATVPYSETIVGPGQEPGRDVPYLNHAAGTKGGWGGPDPSHSAYEVIFDDDAGEPLTGSAGIYTVTTEEPPVDAFWSVTVYDTERGGFLHPNDHDRYHINNTTAVRNPDGTVTFTFKQTCTDADLNCLEVPAGRFDVVPRFYLPRDEVLRGEWNFPRPRRT